MTPKCSTLKCIQESKPGGFTAKFEYYTLSRLFYDREGIENRNCCRLVQLNEIDSFWCLPSLSFSRGKSDIEIIFFSRRSPRDIRHFHCRRALRVLISEALRPRLIILLQTTNYGLRLTVSRYLSAHIWDLRFADDRSRLPCLLPFIHFLTPIIVEKLPFAIDLDNQYISKRVLESCIPTQTWDCGVVT